MNITKVENDREYLFKQGREKTGGRKKGTPNKRTQTLMERLEGVDIVGELLNIAQTTFDMNLSASIYKDLMKYVYPQRKAIDVTSTNLQPTIYINRQCVEAEM